MYDGYYYVNTDEMISSISGSLVNGTASINIPDMNLAITTLQGDVQKIKERLLILEPKQELLEKHEMLRKAYEEYKILEALLTETK